jgi:hypothetical protein
MCVLCCSTDGCEIAPDIMGSRSVLNRPTGDSGDSRPLRAGQSR